MPKIIILKIEDLSATHGVVNVEYLFWLRVKPGSEIPLPVFQSAWLAASPEQTEELQKGRLVEKRKTRQVPVDLSTPEARALALATAPGAIKALLVTEYQKDQAIEDARLSPLTFYGITFDDNNQWSE